MSKAGLIFPVRMLCVFSLAYCVALCHAPNVHGNPLLKGIRDKASVLELMLRRTPTNQCERYYINAGKADKNDYSTTYSWLNKYELDEDGELEQRLLSKLPPELKAKVDARLPKVYSEIENKKKGL